MRMCGCNITKTAVATPPMRRMLRPTLGGRRSDRPCARRRNVSATERMGPEPERIPMSRTHELATADCLSRCGDTLSLRLRGNDVRPEGPLESELRSAVS